MKVDLPSLPVEIGGIIARRNELVVASNDGPSRHGLSSDLISIKTMGGKLNAVYLEGSLYILLPKSA